MTNRWAEILEADRLELERQRANGSAFQTKRKDRPFPKPKSLGNGPLTLEERAEGKRVRRLHVLQPRPRTRGECIGKPRPCGFVSCRFNLFLDFNPRTGSVKLNFPGAEIDELPETCALDVADRGGHTLEQVGLMINQILESVRQTEDDALHAVEVELRLRWRHGVRKNLDGFAIPAGIDLPDAP